MCLHCFFCVWFFCLHHPLSVHKVMHFKGTYIKHLKDSLSTKSALKLIFAHFFPLSHIISQPVKHMHPASKKYGSCQTHHGTSLFPSVLNLRLRWGLSSLYVTVILRLVRSVCAAAARMKVSQKICLIGWIKNLCNSKQDHTGLWCRIILTLDLTLWHQWIFCRWRNMKHIIPFPSSGDRVRFNTTGRGHSDGHFKDCGNCEHSFGLSRCVRPKWLTWCSRRKDVWKSMKYWALATHTQQRRAVKTLPRLEFGDVYVDREWRCPRVQFQTFPIRTRKQCCRLQIKEQ